jgi:hypothetical protein
MVGIHALDSSWPRDSHGCAEDFAGIRATLIGCAACESGETMRRWSAYVIAVSLLCQSALAQETGSVSGTVTQPNGETLPGVLVEAAGDALVGPVTTTTSASGEYGFHFCLQASTYSPFHSGRGPAKNEPYGFGRSRTLLSIWSCSSAFCRKSWSLLERCLKTFRWSRWQ